jgi:hypothetical protein
MNENEDFGFEEFESELFGDDYQTDDETAADDSTEAKEVSPGETDHEAEEGSGSCENSEDENTDDSEEDGAEEDTEADSNGSDAAQTFKLKVNKEEREVTLEEMTTLAQKGADYDRVKEQNAQRQQTIESLQSQLNEATKHQGALDILGMIAEKSGSTLDELAESLYVNFRKSSGASEDAAHEELKNVKLEKELNAFKNQKAKPQDKSEDGETRAKRDLEEFSKEYPGVELTKEMVGKLIPDINSGLTLVAAYRKYERAQDAAKIAELERKLAATAQNAKNKKSSPGSQKDSGGRRTKTDYEEFERALFG